jgi:chlorobactene glucosyltransferase
MVLLVISIIWISIVAGLLSRAITQYGHYEVIAPVDGFLNGPSPTVDIIVPARNEETAIGRCVQALATQDYPHAGLRIAVVDDHSVDRTADVVRLATKETDNLRLERIEGLPAGWLGKPHACWRGASQGEGDWLCFIDADTVSMPPLVRTAIHIATTRELDLLSLQPFQDLGSVWERLILPCGFFLIAFTQDLRKTNDPTSSEASVNGQFLLIRRSVYFAVGGHASVRDAVAEDSALARRVKAAGYRVAVLGTVRLLHTRMYLDFRSLCEGAARQAASLLPGTRLPLMTVGALVLAWVPVALPLWAICEYAMHGGIRSLLAMMLASVGSLALFGTHVGAARYFRIPVWYGLLFPIGYTMGAGILLFAVLQRSNHQMRWKGRVYNGAPDASSKVATATRSSDAPGQS